MNIQDLKNIISIRLDQLFKQLEETPSTSYMWSSIMGEIDGLKWVLEEIEGDK